MSDRRHLRLVSETASGLAGRDRRSQAAYDLVRQPQRPGDLCGEVVLTVPADDSARYEEEASRLGLPVELWATLAAEASRSIATVCALTGKSGYAATGLLDEAALDSGVDFHRTRLNDYAKALRTSSPRPTVKSLGRIALRPSLSALTAWEVEAERIGTSSQAWALAAVESATGGFVGWEAAAADRGQSMVEWATLQAARRRRSERARAHRAG